MTGTTADEVASGSRPARSRAPRRARATRPQPARDDKVLAGWNGLALARLRRRDRRARGDRRRRPIATAAGRYRELAGDRRGDASSTTSGRPTAACAGAGRTAGPSADGVLEDHAYLADGLLALYEATFDERWFVAARELADTILGRFADPAGGFFDTGDDHETLVTRPKDLQDNAVPSGNAMAATVLLELAALTGDGRYRDAAERALGLVAGVARSLSDRLRPVARRARLRAGRRGRGGHRRRPGRSRDAAAAGSGPDRLPAAPGRRLRCRPGRRARSRCSRPGSSSTAARPRSSAATSPAASRSTSPRRWRPSSVSRDDGRGPRGPAGASTTPLGEVTVAAYLTVGEDGHDGYLDFVRDVATRAATCPVFVAVDAAGAVLGGVTYVPGPGTPYSESEGEGEAGFRMLAVDPAAQGRGVGRALVEACIARARADGRGRLVLLTRPLMADAHALYLRMGFRRAPERDWRAGARHRAARASCSTSGPVRPMRRAVGDLRGRWSAGASRTTRRPPVGAAPGGDDRPRPARPPTDSRSCSPAGPTRWPSRPGSTSSRAAGSRPPTPTRASSPGRRGPRDDPDSTSPTGSPRSARPGRRSASCSPSRRPDRRARRPARRAGSTVRRTLVDAARTSTLRTDDLVEVARWTTPRAYPRRFDARFFVAELPPGAVLRPGSARGRGHAWLTPRAALAAMAAGSIAMWPPTSTTLQRLERAAIVRGRSGRAWPAPRSRRSGSSGSTPGLRVMTGQSAFGPGGRPANTVLVGRREVVVVDPGDPGEAFLDAIEAEVAADGGRIVAIALTHVDPVTPPGSEELHERTGAPILVGPGRRGRAVVGGHARSATARRVGRGDGPLTAVATPGHRPDHLAFLAADGTLIAGDALTDRPTLVLPPEGDPRAQRATRWPGSRPSSPTARCAGSSRATARRPADPDAAWHRPMDGGR